MHGEPYHTRTRPSSSLPWSNIFCCFQPDQNDINAFQDEVTEDTSEYLFPDFAWFHVLPFRTYDELKQSLTISKQILKVLKAKATKQKILKIHLDKKNIPFSKTSVPWYDAALEAYNKAKADMKYDTNILGAWDLSHFDDETKKQVQFQETHF